MHLVSKEMRVQLDLLDEVVHLVVLVCVEILDPLDQLAHLVERESEEEMDSRVSRDIQVPVVKKDHLVHQVSALVVLPTLLKSSIHRMEMTAS